MQRSAPYKPYRPKPNQTGAIRYVLILGLLLGTFAIFRSVAGHALSNGSPIKSGIAGYCLDDRDNSAAQGTEADASACNATAAQDWTVTGDTITRGDTHCLAVQNNAQSAGSAVVSNTCDSSAGQIWLRDKSGFINPNSGLCLDVPGGKTGSQLDIANCTNLSRPGETWTATINDSGTPKTTAPCGDTEGQKVACYAEKEWAVWQSGKPNHETLLNNYTDGAPYEEWCADFVSYVYKEAGYPFKGGETDGWDENIAGNIQNLGFTKHAAAGYTPKAGDVAYFNYNGGHVEIVISGGKTPTFIYGNSSAVDPATGNGRMAANTMTSDGSAGQLIYYLSPNGS
ncbi:MAG TPA: ricin-type beta-trefoil lectin domain protein [Candidatus Dormibacteraeota bacterium]|nr:ricin-type beta-trefoil lectin domain protein [Candidatus Dormibacteraeota bacterium]